MSSTFVTEGSMTEAAARNARIVASAVDILGNTALPYVAWLFLRHAGWSAPHAVEASALIPAAFVLIGFVRQRRLNFLSVVVLLATCLMLLASSLSGLAWFGLVQPSIVTGGVALYFTFTLLLSRPILFYLARDTTCHSVGEVRSFEEKWSNPTFRRNMRRLTVVWAAFLGGEALFRLVLVSLWPSPTVSAATQILWVVLPILLVRWSIRAGKKWSETAK